MRSRQITPRSSCWTSAAMRLGRRALLLAVAASAFDPVSTAAASPPAWAASSPSATCTARPTPSSPRSTSPGWQIPRWSAATRYSCRRATCSTAATTSRAARAAARAQGGWYSGGRVATLLGNHEVLNALGELAYVSLVGMRQADRAKAFAPSELRELAEWPSRASSATARRRPPSPRRPHLADGGADRDGERGGGAARRRRAAADGAAADARQPGVGAPLLEPRRRAAGGACAELRDALQLVGAERLVVGHTVQNRINGACGGAVYRIDVGMSIERGGLPEALEGATAASPCSPRWAADPPTREETVRAPLLRRLPRRRAPKSTARWSELPPPPASRCEAVEGSAECEVLVFYTWSTSVQVVGERAHANRAAAAGTCGSRARA